MQQVGGSHQRVGRLLTRLRGVREHEQLAGRLHLAHERGLHPAQRLVGFPLELDDAVRHLEEAIHVLAGAATLAGADDNPALITGYGVIDAEHPALSGLALSMVDRAGQPQEAFLHLHDVYNLRLNADLVVLSSVQYRTGEWISNLPKFMRAAKTAGALVLLDVYQHAGAIPLDVAALGIDFAIGGCAKYLRGGPGAGWLYVRPGLVETLRTPDTGWFAKEKPFAHERPEPPQFAAGGDAWLESTPSVLAPIQALAGLEMTLELGVDRLRDYSIEQKQLLADFLNLRGVASEGAGDEHGAFLTVQHEDPLRLAAALARHHIVADAAGDRLRLCPDILNTESELAQVAEELGALLA